MSRQLISIIRSRRFAPFALILAVTGLAAIAFWQNRFAAFDDFVPTSVSAVINIAVTQNGQPGVGTVFIDGDCPDQLLTTQSGTVRCRLESTSNNLQISAVTFHSFDSEIVYTVAAPTPERAPIRLEPGKTVDLRFVINDGGASLQDWSGRDFFSGPGT